jgi:glycosyltransferase involved in cell wall biosynthesis
VKVIHLAMSAGGGAGIAAGRGVEALRELGVAAEFWTAEGNRFGRPLRSHRWTTARILMDSIPLRFYQKRRLFSAWSNNWQSSRLADQINREKPDIVHVHWIGSGFLALDELSRFEMPLVWTLHDLWAFTGGCHYPDKCVGYVSGCGACPQLASTKKHDLSRRNFQAKRMHLHSVAAFITPSTWLAELVKTSGGNCADRLHVIPNGFDGKVFFPRDREMARRSLELPTDALILVAGAQDLREPRKGLHFFREAMVGIAAAMHQRCVVILFGARGNDSAHYWPCETRWLGTLAAGEETALVYCAADALLMSSVQDNLPSMPIEALGCGCPTIAFNVGGMREIIESGQTGMLADDVDSAGLSAAVIAWFKQMPERSEVLANCSARFEKLFASRLHAERLNAVYEQVLTGDSRHGDLA